MAVYSEEADGSRIYRAHGKVDTAGTRGIWLPKGAMCGRCSFKEHYSEFGGAVLPRPVDEHASGSVEHWDSVRHDQDGALSGLG
jgi:hypothetical protein